MNKNKLIGSLGERAAAEYLRTRRYRILAMNYACRFGELDLIAENRDCVVFVEVKRRKSAAFALAREFVTPAKQRRVAATAALWLAKHPTEKQPRFAAIEIYAPEGQSPTIQHIENAFEVSL